VEAKIFSCSQSVIEGRVLKDYSDRPSHLVLFSADITTGNPGASRSWSGEGTEHSYCGRLTGAIWSKEAEYLPAFYGKRNVVNRDKTVEIFC